MDERPSITTDPIEEEPTPPAGRRPPLWRRRPVQTAAAAVVVLAAAAWWATRPASPPHTADTTTTTPAAAPTPDPDAEACRVIAAMQIDVSTPDTISTTQDQWNAALNLLHQRGDTLTTDMLTAEKDMVTLGSDLLAVQLGGTDAAYQSDLPAFEGALRSVERDCAGSGVAVSLNVRTRG